MELFTIGHSNHSIEAFISLLQRHGTLVTARGECLTDAGITDPVFVEKLEAGYRPQNSCLVTVSLSMPHRPPNWEGDDPCWKLIAGVTELDERSQMQEVQTVI